MKMGKKQRLKVEHPKCCFCGGIQPTTTTDHVPPKACFPDGYFPEGFEFPACEKCNHGTKKHDQIFGFYSQCLDFNETNHGVANQEKVKKLGQAIAPNYPDALPNPFGSRPIRNVGSIVTPTPIAYEVEIPSAFKTAADVIGRKLTHALYFRERGKPMTQSHNFVNDFYQIQKAKTVSITTYFNELLPDQTTGFRSNIKDYGDRFIYKSGVKEKEDFFMYAAQFGRGLILWGMVLGPEMMKDVAEPGIKGIPWRKGGCGAGNV